MCVWQGRGCAASISNSWILAGCSGGQLTSDSTRDSVRISRLTGSVLQDCRHPLTSDARLLPVLTDCSHRFLRLCFSSLNNLLEQLAEPRVKNIFLTRIVVLIKGYNSGRERQRRCTGQGMEWGKLPGSLQACHSIRTASLHQSGNTPNPSFWGFLRKQGSLNH